MLVYIGISVPIICKIPSSSQLVAAKLLNIELTSAVSNPEEGESMVKFLKFDAQTLDEFIYSVMVLLPLILK